MEIVNSVLEYINGKYGVEPERPWMKYPEDMTFKAKENGKWFAVIMRVNGKSLGLANDSEKWIINVKLAPGTIAALRNDPGYLPAYHMNKEHWISALLDGSVSMESLIVCIDESYEIVTDSPTKRIYEAVKQIPRGRVATYGQIAEMAGNRKMARAVGNALHKNPDPDGIPCYRVVNSKGELASEFVFGGAGVQAAMLEADGIEVINNRVDLKKYGI